jgi:hypothetical protein
LGGLFFFASAARSIHGDRDPVRVFIVCTEDEMSCSTCASLALYPARRWLFSVRLLLLQGPEVTIGGWQLGTGPEWVTS